MHADYQELLALRDGDPVDAQAAQHVSQCADCSRALAQLNALQEQLRRLPAFEAPERAWAGIRRRLERAPQRQRNPWPMVGLAASIMVTVLVLPLLHREPGMSVGHAIPGEGQNPAGAGQDSLGALVMRSQRLEAVLQVLPRRPVAERAGTSATIDELQNRIQMLDLQLSAAGRGDAQQPAAAHEDARRLWSARVELMNSLVHVRYAEAAGNADLSETASNLGAL